MAYPIGQVKFEKSSRTGEVLVGNHWNPPSMTTTDRKKVASSLREIADRMERDEFEDACDWKYYPPRPEPAAN